MRGISDLITVHGLINLDFADVRTIMAEMGMAMMGAGSASGENRAVEAAQKAIASPLLEDISIHGAKGVLINITGGHDLSLHEVNEAATLIQEEAHEDANIIFGAVIDERMGDEIRITVIATGFGEAQREVKKPGFSASKELGHARIPHDPAAQRGARDVTRRVRSFISGRSSMTSSRRPTCATSPRRTNGSGQAKDTPRAEEFTMADDSDDQFEIPAFLRKNVG